MNRNESYPAWVRLLGLFGLGILASGVVHGLPAPDYWGAAGALITCWTVIHLRRRSGPGSRAERTVWAIFLALMPVVYVAAWIRAGVAREALGVESSGSSPSASPRSSAAARPGSSSPGSARTASGTPGISGTRRSSALATSRAGTRSSAWSSMWASPPTRRPCSTTSRQVASGRGACHDVSRRTTRCARRAERKRRTLAGDLGVSPQSQDRTIDAGTLRTT